MNFKLQTQHRTRADKCITQFETLKLNVDYWSPSIRVPFNTAYVWTRTNSTAQYSLSTYKWSGVPHNR